MSTRRIALIAASALLTFATLTSCTSEPGAHAASASSTTATTHPQAAMDKLEESVLRAYGDISPAGITGQQIDSNPATKVGDDVFPANTRTRQLNGTPYGSPNFQTAYGGISMAYLNGHIGDAQDGVKYVGDEQIGGYDTRLYDFDLTGVDATIKRAMKTGNAVGLRQTSDYNMKGSAWIAKEDSRMVKFSFDNIYTFTDGKTSDTHFEETITKKWVLARVHTIAAVPAR